MNRVVSQTLEVLRAVKRWWLSERFKLHVTVLVVALSLLGENWSAALGWTAFFLAERELMRVRRQRSPA